MNSPESGAGHDAGQHDRRRGGARSGGGRPPPAIAGIATARRYAGASRAASTRDKYNRAWDAFDAWCGAQGVPALPAHTGNVAVYLAGRAESGLSPAVLAAIGWVHHQAGHMPPHRAEGGSVVADVLAGARRTHGRPARRKAAADVVVLAAVLASMPGEDLLTVRDRALLVFGMACCLWRSELVALHIEDLERVPERLRVTVRHSKTDQEARDPWSPCPRAAAAADGGARGLAVRGGRDRGPVFRRLSRDGTRALPEAMSNRAVARVVQARVAAADLDPALFGWHSLWAGFIAAEASAFRMREVSRHKSIQVLAD